MYCAASNDAGYAITVQYKSLKTPKATGNGACLDLWSTMPILRVIQLFTWKLAKPNKTNYHEMVFYKRMHCS